MEKNQITLLKYELKNISYLFLLHLFFIVIYMAQTINTQNDFVVSYMYHNNLYTNLDIIAPKIGFYILIVLLLARIQLKDGFNKLWHYFPFKNAEIINIKILSGLIFFAFAFVTLFLAQLFIYLKYLPIYKDVFEILGVNTSIIPISKLALYLLIVFLVFVFFYFVTIILNYFLGNIYFGILTSTMLLFIPIILLSLSNMSLTSVFNKFFNLLAFENIRYAYNNEYILNFELLKFISVFYLLYYFLLSAIFYLILRKMATTPKIIENSNPFNIKYSGLFFQIVMVVFCTISTQRLFAFRLVTLCAFVFTIFLSKFIVKKWGVRE